MLTKPPHILAAKIADKTPSYAWDEWRVEEAYQPADPEFMAAMARVSHRANVAFCIASAEWIVWRFEHLFNNPMPLVYLEAMWTANIHTAYGRYIETDDDDWRGVVKGPINIALAIVIDLVWGIEDTVPGENASWIANLANLVIADASPYERWRKEVLGRLEELSPRPVEVEENPFEDDEDPGPWVPREVFDTTHRFDGSRTREYLTQFLNSVDYNTNEFLYSPSEVLEFPDFETVPYELP